MTKKKRAPAGDPQQAGGPRLEVALPPGKSLERLTAEFVIEGEAGNAETTRLFSKGSFGDVSLTDGVQALRATTAEVKRGDLSAAERLLVAQAVALNAIFGEMARRAAWNMGEHLGAMDTYLRLSLKAQSQCRATLEALAEIKNPRPVAFVKQANIAHGPQQVNNGAPQSDPAHSGVRTAPAEPAGELIAPREELPPLTAAATAEAVNVRSHDP